MRPIQLLIVSGGAKVIMNFFLTSFLCAIFASYALAYNPAEDVRILLYTRTNRNSPVELQFNVDSIRNSPFVSSRETRVITHGWGGDGETDFITGATPALLDAGDFNIIVIDWSAGAQTINYIAAVQRVNPTGVYVGSFMDFLQENGFVNYARVKLIGFSLGAHVVGFIGKNVQRGQIDTIIGLDPAGPLFSVNTPSGRLDAGDARYVEAIHTNGPTLLLVGAGIGAPIAHADFFPNGGRSQPGCILNACSHDRAVDYYLESLQSNGFFGLRCANANDAQNGNCNGTPGAWISSEPSNGAENLRGIFHFRTNSAAPFAQGPIRP